MWALNGVRSAPPPGKSNVLKKRLGEPQSRYGSWGEETNTVSLPHRSQIRTGGTKRQMRVTSYLWFRTKIRGVNIFDKNMTRRDEKKGQTDIVLTCVNVGRSHAFCSWIWGGGQLPPRSFVTPRDFNSEGFVLFSLQSYICQVLQSQVFILCLLDRAPLY